MHLAHFIQRYPPALGGSEVYFERLARFHIEHGDSVTVWTSTAIELEEMWQKASHGRQPAVQLPLECDQGETNTSQEQPADAGRSPVIRRSRPLTFPGRRYILKALSLIPIRPLQCLAMPCNPVCPAMWRDAGRYDGPLDAVHASAFPYAFPLMCGLRLARRRKVPFFLTPFLHLGDDGDSQDRTRRQYTAPHLRGLLQQADGVFVQTRLERDAVVALGIPEDRVILQGLGVEVSECTGGDREAVRASWRLEPHEVAIGHLANNSPEKGSIDLLKSAEQAWNIGKQFRVVLAGPEMPAFRNFWEGFKTKERVIRLGVLSDKAKRDFFAGIDAFALPSRSDSFGLVLLEAWANGKPCLVYRAGGPGELVRYGFDGLHAKCGDVAELARQLGRLIESDRLRRELGANGRARLTREFQWAASLGLVRTTIAINRACR